MINTREELINALTEAAELEHNLLIQYLFSSFTLKTELNEGLTPLQQAKNLEWKGIILSVAREEMGHLGLVCNLLSAIGAAPRFGRPNLPQSEKKYYPFEAPFTLTRFSRKSLYRFLIFELPIGENPPEDSCKTDQRELMIELFSAPDPLIYNKVGDLYNQIKQGFITIPEKELFIGPKKAQDSDDWSVRLNLQNVNDRKTAIKAIDDIIIDGEGTSSDREGSHYNSFKNIWEELCLIDYDPARNVVENPFTRSHRDSSDEVTVNLITNKETLKVSEIFNTIYSSTLLMLMQYYSYSGETENERNLLRSSLGQIMSGIVRPLGELLTKLPINKNASDGFAAPSFEIYSDLRLSPFKENRWLILNETFNNVIDEIKLIEHLDPRFLEIKDKLIWLNSNLQSSN